MRILIIRHADPDYEHDSLTEKGWREAEYLTKRLSVLTKEDREHWYFYVSPLGRAKDTASGILKELGMEAEVKEWLPEFDCPVLDPVTKKRRICWDFLPEDWTGDERYYGKDSWGEPDIMKEAGVREHADWVGRGLDEVLAKHGYVREGNAYRAEKANTDTIVFFCHFGVESVMLSHLMNLSPVILWHFTCALPSSVTSLVSEERKKGTAIFRMNGFGDLTHLHEAGEPASFAGRFCECFDHDWERH